MKDWTQVILKPVITERTNTLKEENNKFVFEVNPMANKREIKQAVEKLFNVKVMDVHTSILHGKPKTTFMRGGRFIGKRPTRKKAIVRLAAGQNIDIFDQV
jgi:large subunit ribosomal protein L23